MRSYPVWHRINSCAYESPNKSYGVLATGEVNVCVGSGSSDRHDFLTHVTTHRQYDNGEREFRFYVDGTCIKRGLLKKGEKKLTRLNSREVNTEVNG